MRQLGTIIAIALIIGAGSALAVIQDGTDGGASANDSRSPAQQCRDEGLVPGSGNAFGKCVAGKASAFGKCVSAAAKNGAGNPTESCAALKPPRRDGDVNRGGSASSPAQQCRDEGSVPGNGNAFGKCVAGKASAFGKCVSGAAGPGAGNPAKACDEPEPDNGNLTGAGVEAPPAEPSVPPEQIEQAPGHSAAPQTDTGGDDRVLRTGGVAVPSK